MKDSKVEQEAPTTNSIFWRVDEWFPDLSPEVKTQLKSYHSELVRFNKTVNLVSPKSLVVADVMHFADSLLACKTIFTPGHGIDRIFDFGSGNGFPGLVAAILHPEVQVVLVDTDQRKCEFLKHVASALKLGNVTVENKSVEKFADNSVKFALCRGFASISKAIMLTRKVVVKGGVFYHLKSEEWGMEVSEIPSQLCSLWFPSLVGEYKLPGGAVKFSVVKTEKIA